MKVFLVYARAFGLNQILVAANSINEANEIVDIAHFGVYFDETIQCTNLTANVDKPQILYSF